MEDDLSAVAETVSETVDEKLPEWLARLGQLIENYGGPVEVKRVMKFAEEFGAPPSTPRILGRTLKSTFPQIQWPMRDPEESTCRWDESALAAPVANDSAPVAALLKQLVGADDEERRALIDDARSKLRGVPEDEPEVHLARLLGVVPGEPEWAKIRVDMCLEIGALEIAVRVAPGWWCVGAALQLKPKDGASARERFASFDEAERTESICELMERWLSHHERQGVSELIRKLRALIGGPPNQTVVSLACRQSVGVATEPNSERILSALLGLIVAGEPAEIVSSLDSSVSKSELRGWLVRLANGKTNAGDRSVLLSAAARSIHAQAIYDADVFSGFGLSELGEVINDGPIKELLESGLSDHLFVPVKSAVPPVLGRALAVVAEHPVLEHLMPLDFLEQLARRDEVSARVARASMRGIVESSIQEERRRRDEEVGRITEELEMARADTEGSSHAVEQERRRVLELEDRLRSAIDASSRTTESELRQARIDVLRAMVDHAIVLGDAASVEHGSSRFASLLSAVERELAGFGVEVVGVRGDVVAYDSAIHESLDIPVGTLVRIVRPTYMITGVATPLRRGLVTVG